MRGWAIRIDVGPSLAEEELFHPGEAGVGGFPGRG